MYSRNKVELLYPNQQAAELGTTLTLIPYSPRAWRGLALSLQNSSDSHVNHTKLQQIWKYNNTYSRVLTLCRNSVEHYDSEGLLVENFPLLGIADVHNQVTKKPSSGR